MKNLAEADSTGETRQLMFFANCVTLAFVSAAFGTRAFLCIQTDRESRCQRHWNSYVQVSPFSSFRQRYFD